MLTALNPRVTVPPQGSEAQAAEGYHKNSSPKRDLPLFGKLDNVEPAVRIAASGMIGIPAPRCEPGHACWPPSRLSIVRSQQPRQRTCHGEPITFVSRDRRDVRKTGLRNMSSQEELAGCLRQLTEALTSHHARRLSIVRHHDRPPIACADEAPIPVKPDQDIVDQSPSSG